MDDEIRKLAMQLAESSRRGEGARLEPRSVVVALSALRTYVQSRSDKSPTDAQATSRDPVIPRAAFDEARKRRPDTKVIFRPGAPRASESA
jgi:hypothetical protein